MEDDNDVPLRLNMRKKWGSKRKEKDDQISKVVKSYITRIVEKKLVGDSMKASKSATSTRRRMK